MQFKVEKMGCGGCAKTISTAIHTIDPSAKVDIDLGKKRVEVISKADQAVIQQVISDAGFPSEPMA